MSADREIPVCDATGHCVTCSDEAVPMRVVEARAADGTAVCEAEGGARSDVMVDLVGPVDVGDSLLVHAGVALAREGGR